METFWPFRPAHKTGKCQMKRLDLDFIEIQVVKYGRGGWDGGGVRDAYAGEDGGLGRNVVQKFISRNELLPHSGFTILFSKLG